MAQTRWYQEKKREHFYREAKALGYRARSAFKLLQIHKRFSLFKPGDTVIDLGAAPGGWSQVAAEHVGDKGRVIAIDLSMMNPIPGVEIIQGDISADSTQRTLAGLIQGQVDIVISDMSPDVTGTYSVDQARSLWLCEQALDVARKFLKPGGHFVCKLFEGEDSPKFFDLVKGQFRQIKRFSPEASRKSSSEIYVIAKGFLPK
jgi:23S rRNA (uridine2552-2'-O)-methyltransferase